MDVDAADAGDGRCRGADGSSAPTPDAGGAARAPAVLRGAACRGADGPSAHTAEAGEAARAPAESMLPFWHSRGYLPHVENKAVQFITYRLFDSVPTDVTEAWKHELSIHEKTDPNAPECQELRRRVERYADEGHGSCLLRDPRIAALVQENLLHFDSVRYRLLNWCVMPNHVHALVEVAAGWTVSKIVQGWRSYTAHVANKILNRNGTFWQPEYFDRYIRNERHLRDTNDYIDGNPEKAGLFGWPWCRKAVCRSADGPSAHTTDAGGAARAPAEEGVETP